MRRLVVCLALAAAALPAAVIRGTVVENQTSKPLSRVTISLEPVSGTPAKSGMTRTDRYGAFAFDSLPAGAYLIKASRRGFRPTSYGQKNWNAAARPLAVAAESSAFVTLRLPRYGAIEGTVLDENDVGVPQQTVVAYRATEPPQLASRGMSDDRGIYRISGLDPGTYLVRTAGNRDEGVDYLPTFSRETLRPEEARTVEVSLDEDTRNMDVRPIAGRLVTLAGTVVTMPPNVPSNVTLVSETGRQTVPGPTFQFNALPPGNYELYAEAPENAALHAVYQAAYLPLQLDRNRLGLPVQLEPVRESRVELDPQPGNLASGQLLVRRKDYAGVGAVQMVPLTDDRALLPPGRWELMLNPPFGFYVSAFSSPTSRPSAGNLRPDGWNEIFLNGFGLMRFSLTGGPGSVHGMVTAAGDAVAGAPVYLEAYDPVNRKRLTDLRSARADLRGMYRFDGLAPGLYRVLATFEYDAPDSATLDLAGARQIQIEARSDLQSDLDLYGER
jgi:hypothetical protein